MDARLWQDPFAAVASHIAEGNDPNRPLPRPLSQFLPDFLSSSPETDHAKLPAIFRESLVIAVSVPGTPYAEDGETRRRLRYAILAALNVKKYHPAHPEHLGYVRLPNALSPSSPVLASIVPFEFISTNHIDSGGIGLLWIDENILTSKNQPLHGLSCIIGALDLNASRLKFIGPQTSVALKLMLQEFDNPQAQPTTNISCPKARFPQNLQQLEIFNYSASIDEKSLFRVPNPNNCYNISLCLRDHGISYHKILTSDELLARSLVDELSRRNVNLINETHWPFRFLYNADARTLHPNHIALVSEWDTVYAQSLRQTFAKSFATAAKTDVNAATRDWIHSYSYLRGLDGQVPKHTSDDPTVQRRSAPGTNIGEPRSRPVTVQTSDGIRPNERAIGQSQYDYLRRLAESLGELDSNLKKHREGRIAAIGILGSDVYDKILVLQALRPEFPNALFFTTDLDAVLLSHEKLILTRNLLVGSSFDLLLRDALQLDVPPFRSSYQTAAFLAVQLAVISTVDNRHRADEFLSGRLEQTRLFEIGRTHAIALANTPQEESTGRPSPDDNQCREDIFKCEFVHPRIANAFPPFALGIGLLASAFVIVLAVGARYLWKFFLVTRRNPEEPRLTGIRVRLAQSVGLGITAILIIIIYTNWSQIGMFMTENGIGEPIYLLEGNSIWLPTALRLVSFCVSMYLVFLTFWLLNKNLASTHKELALPESEPYHVSVNELLAFRRWLPHLLGTLPYTSVIIPERNAHERVPTYPIHLFLAKYHYQGSPFLRTMRAIIWTTVMMLFGVVLGLIWGFPNAPTRGWLAEPIYRAISLLDVFATLFLTFLIIDATLYSRSFIVSLNKVRSEWPLETVSQYSNELDMPGPYIDDWIDIQWIAHRTGQITNLIYFPFIALAMMIISRNKLFDAFTFSVMTAIIQAITCSLIIGSVLALRGAAETARAVALRNLTGKLVAARRESSTRAVQLEVLIERIQNLKDGAFAPWSTQPLIRAFLVPLFTYGGATLLQIYALSGS